MEWAGHMVRKEDVKLPKRAKTTAEMGGLQYGYT